jgi:type I restriction enzyme S subunit
MTTTLAEMKWKTKPLGEIATIERNAIAPESIPSGTKYVGLENITSEGQFIGVSEVKNGEIASTKFQFTNKHILYGKLRPYLSKVARSDFSGVCSTDILPVLPGEKVDRGFLHHFLRLPEMVTLAASRSIGANLPRLSPRQLAEFEIPLPPLPEQKRIADILEKADALRRKRREAIGHSDNLLPSFFDDFFGPAGGRYKLQPLHKHLEFLTSGSRGWAEHYVESGKRFIRSLDVQMNRIGSDDIVFVNPPPGTEAERTRVRAGDVLVTITGSRIGRVAFVPQSFDEGYVSQHVAIVRLKPSLRPRFCSMYLSLPNGGQRQIAKAQYGQTKPGLSLSNIREFEIPIPPTKEQDRFLDTWDQQDSVLAKQTVSGSEFEELFHSLVQRAFRGEL